MSAAIHNIACLGEVMIELATSDEQTAQIGVAGDTYNTAVYLKQALANTACNIAYITALGEDSFSERIAEHMLQHKICTRLVERRTDKTPGLYAISTDAQGERNFCYWRSDSAARTLFTEPCRVHFSCFRDLDLIFLSGISIAILPPTIRNKLLEAIDVFRASGGLIAFDSNYRPKLWPDQKTAQQTVSAFWQRTDIALPSLDDEMMLFNEDEASVYQRMNLYGARLGAMKRGTRGPTDLYAQDHDCVFPLAETIVDTTAAGDSFNAGFLAAYIQAQDITRCLELGHHFAYQVVQQKGAVVPIQFACR